MERSCINCGKGLTGHNKSIRCTPCAAVFRWADPEYRMLQKMRACEGWRKRLKGRRPGNRTPKGYVRIKVNGRLVMEHRVVMEAKLGRPLTASERVHHMNDKRADNRPENLELKPSQAVHLAEAHHRDVNGRFCKPPP